MKNPSICYTLVVVLLTPHTLVGVAIGATVQNPYIAVPLSFGMHFMGDLIPHWDFYTDTTNQEKITGWRPLAVMADLAVGVAIGMFFTLYGLWVVKDTGLAMNIFLSAIAATLPDALTAPSLYDGKQFPFNIIVAIQSRLQFPAGLLWGTLSQAVVCGFSLLLIARSIGLL